MKILNIGSMNIDKSYGVESFTLAGKTSKALSYRQSIGGKGLNQSIALARAAATVWHGGCIGEDGDEIAEFMLAEGIHLDYLRKEKGPTGHAIIQIDGEGQNCILIHGGANDRVTREFIDEVLKDFEAGDYLLLQYEITNVDYAIRQAHAKGMKVFLNPSPIEHADDIVSIELADCLIVNEVEGEILTGEKDPERILDALCKKFAGKEIVLTLGESGVRYAKDDVRAAHACYEVKAVDTTAAGDTFAGYFIASRAKGDSVETALENASAAAALCVFKPGAAMTIPYLSEVEEFKARY